MSDLIKTTLFVKDDSVRADSRDIAEAFGKEHKNVLRDIDRLIDEEPDLLGLNFELVSVEVPTGNGGTRQTRAYSMDRDGFTLLAMGFTGAKALKWKRQYIAAFNAMEEELRKAPVEIDLRDPLQMNKVAIQLFEVNRELTEKIEQAEKQIEAAKPKTDFYDRFMNADGLINLRGAARALNEPDGKFFAFLKAGIFFYEGKTLVPKVYYREKGYFTVRMTVVDDKARYQAYCTPKGLRWLAKRLGKTLEEAA